MRPDSEKVEVLRKLKLPTLKKLHSHLGCYNYLSRYIKDFASIFAPLYQKVKKNIKFEFNEGDIENWKKLRSSLVTDCLLVNSNPQKEVKQMVDASNFAIGGVLLRIEDDWHPIPYFEHKLL